MQVFFIAVCTFWLGWFLSLDYHTSKEKEDQK